MTATERSYAVTASTDDLPTPLTAAEFSVLYYLVTMGNNKVHSLERTRRCAGPRAVTVLQWRAKPYRVDGVAKLQPSDSSEP